MKFITLPDGTRLNPLAVATYKQKENGTVLVFHDDTSRPVDLPVEEVDRLFKDALGNAVNMSEATLSTLQRLVRDFTNAAGRIPHSIRTHF